MSKNKHTPGPWHTKLSAAYNEGVKARRDGILGDENPYRWKHKKLRHEWVCGWLEEPYKQYDTHTPKAG